MEIYKMTPQVCDDCDKPAVRSIEFKKTEVFLCAFHFSDLASQMELPVRAEKSHSQEVLPPAEAEPEEEQPMSPPWGWTPSSQKKNPNEPDTMLFSQPAPPPPAAPKSFDPEVKDHVAHVRGEL
jgi:hypothetical protein